MPPRHQEVLRVDGPLLLPSTDPQSQRVSRVTSRLITALEEQENHVVYGACWPPKHHDDGSDQPLSAREAAERREDVKYAPSGVATSSYMPWRPISSNPLKTLESADWNLYVIDIVGALSLGESSRADSDHSLSSTPSLYQARKFSFIPDCSKRCRTTTRYWQLFWHMRSRMSPSGIAWRTLVSVGLTINDIG